MADIITQITNFGNSLDLSFMIYLFSRLSPFLIVCFFVLQSLFRQDFKGIVYLAGLIFACLFTILFGSFPGLNEMNTKTKLPNYRYNACKLIEFTGGPISYLPLGITILGFTFFYLGYNVVKYQLYEKNKLMIILFTLLIINDFYYNISNKCGRPILLFISLMIGCSIGMLWGYLIDILGDKKLQIISGTNLNTSCMKSPKAVYKCKSNIPNVKRPEPGYDMNSTKLFQ